MCVYVCVCVCVCVCERERGGGRERGREGGRERERELQGPNLNISSSCGFSPLRLAAKRGLQPTEPLRFTHKDKHPQEV